MVLQDVLVRLLRLPLINLILCQLLMLSHVTSVDFPDSAFQLGFCEFLLHFHIIHMF